jgi:hypothetical protein
MDRRQALAGLEWRTLQMPSSPIVSTAPPTTAGSLGFGVHDLSSRRLAKIPASRPRTDPTPGSTMGRPPPRSSLASCARPMPHGCPVPSSVGSRLTELFLSPKWIGLNLNVFSGGLFHPFNLPTVGIGEEAFIFYTGNLVLQVMARISYMDVFWVLPRDTYREILWRLSEHNLSNG